MTETKSLVLEHLQALLKRQEDMHADLQEMRMSVRSSDEQLGELDHLVSALATNDSEAECITDRLDPSEGQR